MSEQKEVARGATWEMHISYPFPAGVLIQCLGYLDISSAAPSRVAMQSVIDSGRKLHAFINLCEVSGFDSHLRSSQGQWFRARMQQIETFHVLLDSPLTTMAVGFVSRLLNNRIQMYHDEKRFLVALNAATDRAWCTSGEPTAEIRAPYIFDCSKRITRYE